MMRRHHLPSLALAAVLTFGFSAPSDAAADGFAVICTAKASPPRLSGAELRALYTGRIKTLGGAVVVVVVRPDDDAPFIEFAEHVFGVPAKTLLTKIKQEVFKGEMARPLKAASDSEVVNQVASMPGTIGIVSANASIHLPKTVIAVAIEN
jgi:ABC-type phosphate transport system substrate-binding protein